MSRKRLFIIVAIVTLSIGAMAVIWTTSRSCSKQHVPEIEDVVEEDFITLFGIDFKEDEYLIDEGVIQSGQTISSIFSKYGVSPAVVDRTAKAADSVFSLRNIRAGNNYTALLTTDSTATLKHFIYEQNLTDYLVISFDGDSIDVHKEHKDITLKRHKHSGEIKSSLWNSVVGAGMPAMMSMELEEIYQWSIDFFGLQEGDHFTVIYDEKYVDSLSVGIGQVWGAIFNSGGKDYYAIPFKQGTKIEYWDEKANSLRKSMLKAPLKYSRISSRFSNSRLHPILKIRRPHHGVDYAAPSGTPVHAVADGTIIFRGWDSKGGGNTIKIRHARGMMTGYLHLRGFAKGISNGTRVSQGDLIGYVGSTGSSTGPHLDYRIWINGKPTDPLKLTAEPAEPITNDNMPYFELVKERILAELNGDIPEGYKVTQLDSLDVYKQTHTPSTSTSTSASE